MTKQILKISNYEMQYICIKDDSKTNPYKIYKTRTDSGNKCKRLVAKYADFKSVLYFLYRECEQ